MIEKATPEHLNAIMDIWLNTNIAAHAFISKDYWKNAFEQVKTAISVSDVYIYHENNVVTGFIGITDNEYIAGLFVDEKFQSQGRGRKLLDYCKQRYSHLTLDVFTENAGAVCFYRANGFDLMETKINPEFNCAEHHFVWNAPVSTRSK